MWVTLGRGIHVIDWEIYPVREGAIFSLAPGRVHSWIFGDSTPADLNSVPSPVSIAGYVLEFDAAFATSWINPEAQQVLLPSLVDIRSLALYIDAEQSKALREIVSNLEWEYQYKELGHAGALQAYFQLFLIRLSRYRSVHHPTHGFNKEEALVQRFRILVDGHFWERLSLQRYAATLGVSKGHLNRMVRKQTGMTASNLVQERIVVEAKRMLTHMSTSILDIANSLGFKDPAYFARLFKKRTGQTPKQFKSAFHDTLKAISADTLKK